MTRKHTSALLLKQLQLQGRQVKSNLVQIIIVCRFTQQGRDVVPVGAPSLTGGPPLCAATGRRADALRPPVLHR